MEDAMILNKSSYERGFAHGSVYKNYKFELNSTGRAFEGANINKSKFRMLF